MVFNSFSYIVFFAILLVFYYTIPNKFRWILLLISSVIFYMAFSPVLILLLLFSVFINYIFSLVIENSNFKKKLLLVAIVLNLSILFVFKYFLFFSDSLNSFVQLIGQNPLNLKFNIILPMGISFYTFQAMGYTIDVYRGNQKAEKNFFKLTLFITFFPQLVAGPIERAESLMPQLYSEKTFSLDNIEQGLRYILFGLFKKIVIADRVAFVVNTVFNSPKNYTGIPLVIASILFTIQIYCDFSGYSDIAIGSAKMLGIDLMQNFKQPFFSSNIKEFWQRWHVSLSGWFKDYVYIPLGGNRNGTAKTDRNIIITFLLSGIWHGANWTFMVWGLLHGLANVVYLKLRNKQRKKYNFIMSLITFIFVVFAFVFFRANSLSDAFYVVSNIFNGYDNITSIAYIYNTIASLGITNFEYIMLMASIFLLMSSELYAKDGDFHKIMSTKPLYINCMYYFVVLFFILSFGVYNGSKSFIYFQF